MTHQDGVLAVSGSVTAQSELHSGFPKTDVKEKTMAEVNKWMIDPEDAVMLLIDHQSGLFQLVRDIELPILRAHVTALAKVAHLARIPTFTTASVPDGPNGPLIPEIHQYNPDAVYIPRTGQINAWDNPAWVKAIEETKRKTLLIAGTLTSVCALMESYDKAQNVQKVGRETNLDRLETAQSKRAPRRGR
jgi:nicotinamidase-related amidase